MRWADASKIVSAHDHALGCPRLVCIRPLVIMGWPRELLEALIVLLDFYKDVIEKMVYSTWARLRARVSSLPESDEPVRLLNCDTRRLPRKEGEADFVVTWPQFIRRSSKIHQPS